MKVGEKQRFLMGFNVFASAEDDAPKFAGVAKQPITLIMLDNASALVIGATTLAAVALFWMFSFKAFCLQLLVYWLEFT